MIRPKDGVKKKKVNYDGRKWQRDQNGNSKRHSQLVPETEP